MRRLIVLLCVFVLLLCGCNKQDPVVPGVFYYPLAEYVQAGNNQVFSTEVRETANCNDPGSLVDLYLKGPQSALLRNPFPTGCHLISLTQTDTQITLIISDEFAQLTGINLVIACGSLARTCIELFDVSSVYIQADSLLLDGDKFILMTEDTLLLTDGNLPPN